MTGPARCLVPAWPLPHGYVIDLRRGAVAPVAADGAPVAALEPFVYRDRRAGHSSPPRA